MKAAVPNNSMGQIDQLNSKEVRSGHTKITGEKELVRPTLVEESKGGALRNNTQSIQDSAVVDIEGRNIL